MRQCLQMGAFTRRSLLAAAAAALGVDRRDVRALRDRVLGRPEAFIPSAPEGRVLLEQVHSAARGRDVALFTAAPAGYGAGAGLPVCLVLHGVTARPSDYRGFGLPRVLTAAVRRGAEPFVLVGADGGVLWWESDESGRDSPQRMLLEEMPRWLEERGFDARRVAAWGWSMGGYGALRLAEARPGRLRAVAAFSPAVAPGDRVFGSAARLDGTPLGIWCGLEDPLYPDVQALVAALPDRAEVSYGEGAHTRAYWNGVTLPAFSFLAAHLSRREG
jgi:pimeloyl-ACP methyl ester carboxylesterase